MKEPCSVIMCRSTGRLRRGLCPTHYTRWRRHGDPSVVMFPRNSSTTSGIWQHVEMTADCWVWTGPRNDRGYGRSGPAVAHRVVYERLVGPVPSGMELDHLCRTRHCVRPDHLEPVTHAENVRRSWVARKAASAPVAVMA